MTTAKFFIEGGVLTTLGLYEMFKREQPKKFFNLGSNIGGAMAASGLVHSIYGSASKTIYAFQGLQSWFGTAAAYGAARALNASALRTLGVYIAARGALSLLLSPSAPPLSDIAFSATMLSGYGILTIEGSTYAALGVEEVIMGLKEWWAPREPAEEGQPAEEGAVGNLIKAGFSKAIIGTGLIGINHLLNR